MKQLLIRPIQGAPAVLDVRFGEIEDGQFIPKSLPEEDHPVWTLLRAGDFLGTQLYIPMADFSALLRNVLDANAEIYYAPQFMIISFPEDEPEEEKK